MRRGSSRNPTTSRLEDLRGPILNETKAGSRLRHDAPERIVPGKQRYEVVRGMAAAWPSGSDAVAAASLAADIDRPGCARWAVADSLATSFLAATPVSSLAGRRQANRGTSKQAWLHKLRVNTFEQQPPCSTETSMTAKTVRAHWVDVLTTARRSPGTDGSVGELQMSLAKAVYQTVQFPTRSASTTDITQPTPLLVGFLGRISTTLGVQAWSRKPVSTSTRAWVEARATPGGHLGTCPHPRTHSSARPSDEAVLRRGRGRWSLDHLPEVVPVILTCDSLSPGKKIPGSAPPRTSSAAWCGCCLAGHADRMAGGSTTAVAARTRQLPGGVRGNRPTHARPHRRAHGLRNGPNQPVRNRGHSRRAGVPQRIGRCG